MLKHFTEIILQSELQALAVNLYSLYIMYIVTDTAIFTTLLLIHHSHFMKYF